MATTACTRPTPATRSPGPTPIAPGGPDLSRMQVFPDLEIESFPATDLDPDKWPDAPESLWNKEFGNVADKLHLYRITWSGSKASISDVQTIPLSRSYATPNATSERSRAVQPVTGGQAEGRRGPAHRLRLPTRRQRLRLQRGVRSLQTGPGVLWYEVRISDGKLLQEGLVYDPACDYLNPSLAVDRDGNIGLGCTRTSEKEFPSVVVMMHAKGDPAGSMGAPVLAVPGTTYYRIEKPGCFRIGWGNYSTTCVDPSDPSLLWTCQEYADSAVDRQWCTAWVVFRRKAKALRRTALVYLDVSGVDGLSRQGRPLAGGREVRAGARVAMAPGARSAGRSASRRRRRAWTPSRSQPTAIRMRPAYSESRIRVASVMVGLLSPFCGRPTGRRPASVVLTHGILRGSPEPAVNRG